MRKVYMTVNDFKNDNKNLNTNLPFSDSIEVLSQPVYIGKHKFQNRLACQAMEGCDGTADGKPGELTKRRYKRLACSGASVIWFEATAVMQEARANPHQLFINNKNLDNFKRLVEEIKELSLLNNGFEPKIFMQATHSGRYSKPDGISEPLIAYNNELMEKDNLISPERIVTDDYLDTVTESLINGAMLAEKAGFDGVDIKCCHRYLNSELLSAYNRPGRYGGSLENRTRLLRNSIDGAIHNCSDNFMVSTRLNVYDGLEYPYGFGVKKGGGTTFDQSEPEWILKSLYNLGVRIVNITMGNPYFNPHINRPFAMGGYNPSEEPLEGVKRMLETTAILKKSLPEMKCICSGLSFLGVAAPNVASAFISDGGFDFAGFGRTIFAYPEFANDILKNGGMDSKKCCMCCSKCTEIMRAGGTPGCVIRDSKVYMPIYKKFCGE